MKIRLIHILSIVALLFTSCYRASTQIEPHLGSAIHPKEIFRENRVPICLPKDFSTSPFPPLETSELCQDWGKEYYMAQLFAYDFDLYRAITGFKRALFLIPPEEHPRRLEIQYCIALAYFLGKKYGEVIYEIESTDLIRVGKDFCAFEDLILILYESYSQLGRLKERDHILHLIESTDPCIGEKLCLFQALAQADFCYLNEKKNETQEILNAYHSCAKSVRKAETLNMIFPGAGYWYVGQRQTAVTAFLVNGLFIGAAVAFFENNNIPAALITLSLESGWYFGGIYGAGLAAKYYNERLYEEKASRFSEKESLYPLMMLRYSF